VNNIIYNYYKQEKTKREIEKELIKKLYKISSLIDIINFDSIFDNISDKTILGIEFHKIQNQISSGMCTIKSLKKSKTRMKNKYYSSAIDLLINIYETGSEGSEILLGLAEKITKEQLIEKEKQTNLLIQKYTLISSIFIVPIILGSMISVISSLNFSFLENTQQISIDANYIYIVLNATITSLFLGKLENSKFKILLYAMFFAIISICLFMLAYQGFFTNLIK